MPRWPTPLADRREPLHRQPFKLEREEISQQIADHEHRRGEAEHRQHHHQPVDPRALLPRRQHAHRDRHDQRQHHGQHHERKRRLQALRDHVRDRQVGEDRGAQVAVQYVPQPVAEAHQERPVEPERRTDAVDIRGRRLVPRNDRRRVTGREIEQAEHEEGNGQHHRDGGEDASDSVGEHVSLVPSISVAAHVLPHARDDPERRPSLPEQAGPHRPELSGQGSTTQYRGQAAVRAPSGKNRAASLDNDNTTVALDLRSTAKAACGSPLHPKLIVLRGPRSCRTCRLI